MDFSFIFIGSTHSFVDDFVKQEEVINRVNPEIVLSEELEDLRLDSVEKLRGILKERIVSNMTSFGDVERLVKLCLDKNIKLIGMDFHNFGFDEVLQRKIKKQETLTGNEEKKLADIVNKREKRHLSKILECSEKTSRPIVIILGCWHMRKGSLLREKLKNYKIIAPLDENGEVLFSPDQVKKIKYGEIISYDRKVKN